MSKKRTPWLLIAAGVVVLGTNNLLQFVNNIKSGDPWVYGLVTILVVATAYDLNIGGVFS